MSKRGRPPLPEGEAKGEVLVIRVTAEEMSRLKAWAERDGMSMSEYVRDRVIVRNGIPQSVLDHAKRLAARALDAEEKLRRLTGATL